MRLDLPILDCASAAAAPLAKGEVRQVDVAGPWGSAKTVAAAQAADQLNAPLLIVTASGSDADSVFDDLVTLYGPERCALLPAWEVLPTDMMDPADDIVAERMDTLMRLASQEKGQKPLRVVAPARSLLQRVVEREHLVRESIMLEVGQEHDLEELIDSLSRLGYERDLMVEQRGQMSVRGGIFDVFPISGELPYRIEFFGDEIESIRRFEPETQRSIGHADRIQILPRSEKDLLAEDRQGAKLAAVTDYLPEHALIAIDEPMVVRDEALKLAEQLGESPFFLSWPDVSGRLGAFRRLSVAQVGQERQQGVPRVTAPMRSMTSWQGHADEFWKHLEEWALDEYTVFLLCNNTGERQRLLELLQDKGYRLDRERFDLRVDLGRFRAGFVSPKDKLAVLSEREIFGRHYVRRTRRRFEAGETITSFSDLKAGDYIVHVQHGIGRYLGLRQFEGKTGDFLAIQYSGGDKIYVPAAQIDTVQKFVAGEGALPKIDKLGGATWARTKARVKKAVRDMTQELLQLYAARESREGHAYTPDTHWQVEFEDAFEYEETPDQDRAISEVKRDMESARPMDRLLCGDVGFGKTEVALRAAFKAVMDGKQVAILVPTTVLAEQHYVTFKERLADYPVKVEMLSRFRSPAQIKETLDKLKVGEVDVVVGTHRLVSKDIHFKDLGLVVIDEEQRFGVAQKERLKQLRTTVDVLTMTATPIPRTLNLSLTGVRDMSVINTAPNDRLPIHTLIEHFDEQLIQEAIQRELARGGQVFFVHNRVQTILPFVELVQKLVPNARIGVGHGQMPEAELERIMTAFIRHELDVLVCTTIIGSGIDIPNANTIIINNADRFGLAELYQLRGRVGRYKHRAFAYLLVPGDRALTEDAQKRLKALEEFSTLGSGFRVAMRDLEIRGCGNILGAEQSGQILAVGYETYTQLVAETVAELKGEPVVRRVLPPFDIAVDAHIPVNYVPSEAQKITLYKRISSAKTVAEIDELQEEIGDRFGPVPAPVKRLLDIMRVRAIGCDIGAKHISAGKGAVTVEMESGQMLSRRARNLLAEQFGAHLDFAWQDKPSVIYRMNDGQDPLHIAGKVVHALAEL